jgi:hypothetical protein
MARQNKNPFHATITAAPDLKANGQSYTRKPTDSKTINKLPMTAK